MATRYRLLYSLIVLALLGACGGNDETSADLSDLSVTRLNAGPTPFVAFVQLDGVSTGSVSSLAFTIDAAPGSVSKPVHASYSIAALARRGYVAAGTVTLPVFGLYAGTTNAVHVAATFGDGSEQDLSVSITTAPFTDPNGIYDHPVIRKARQATDALGFDFFAMKSTLLPTVVVDSDGAIRWIGTGLASAAAIFTDNGFVVGSETIVQRVELDGKLTSARIDDPKVTAFTHNIDAGPQGLLAEFTITDSIDATVAEITSDGQVLHTWDIASLLSAYMSRHGDDPTAFVRAGVDWFHLNAATYDPADNGLIVSSRENFVMKLDAKTGDVVWILGDPAKYWYTFASLRARAITLTGGGLVPIGQHAVSITSDGQLLLFNDGSPSWNMPAGAPAGASRSYSTVSAYAIDSGTMTAREVWDFDHGQTIFSGACSSAYQTADKSVLVDYALADGGQHVRIVGLNALHDIVFDFQYNNPSGCDTAWNAVPVPFDHIAYP